MAGVADLTHETLDRIDRAFAGALRPPDAGLLHERCSDDNDIADPALRDFARSELESLDAGERAAVEAFLQAVHTLGDPAEAAEAERALAAWS